MKEKTLDIETELQYKLELARLGKTYKELERATRAVRKEMNAQILKMHATDHFSINELVRLSTLTVLTVNRYLEKKKTPRISNRSEDVT